MVKPRNPAARSPLLRKGGVHTRPRSSQRQHAQRQLDQAIEDWHADVNTATPQAKARTRERQPGSGQSHQSLPLLIISLA